MHGGSLLPPPPSRRAIMQTTLVLATVMSIPLRTRVSEDLLSLDSERPRQRGVISRLAYARRARADSQSRIATSDGDARKTPVII